MLLAKKRAEEAKKEAEELQRRMNSPTYKALHGKLNAARRALEPESSDDMDVPGSGAITSIDGSERSPKMINI